jgi:Chalcone-flavanone isomerase.
MAFRLFLLVCCLAAPAWAAEVAGVKIDDKTRVADTELSLTGAGLRKKLFFQVYAIGLYVREPKADPISQPGPKRVLIHMLRDAGADAFIDALVDGIKQNHSEADARVLEPRVQALAATITDIKEVKKGTRIALDWNGTATQLLIDGKAMGKPVEGEDFYRALLRTWLGDKPIQEDLKKALLGAG